MKHKLTDYKERIVNEDDREQWNGEKMLADTITLDYDSMHFFLSLSLPMCL